MTKTCRLTLFLLLISHLLLPSALFAGEGKAPPSPKKPGRPTLVDAAICEGIDNHRPVNRAVVFSMTLGEVICYTTFDPVPKKTAIFHEWYRKDTLTSKKKLNLGGSGALLKSLKADQVGVRLDIVGGSSVLGTMPTIYTEKISLDKIRESGSVTVRPALNPASLKIAPDARDEITVQYTVVHRK